MSFPLNVYLAAIVAAFASTALSLPLWRTWCLRFGVMDEPGHRKIHQEPIPLAGGLALMTGLLLPLLFGALFLAADSWTAASQRAVSSPVAHAQTTGAISPLDPRAAYLLEYGLRVTRFRLTAILFGALAILTLGWVDDKYELRPRTKFLGQVVVAALVAASGVRITLFVHSILFHYAITILWIVTLVNAFNFMDNMNGLCAGVAAIAAWYFGLLAAAGGQYLVGLIAFLSFGALLGFLPYNFPRARAFLGDAGSHLLGYLLAVLAILPHFYTPRHPRRWAVLLPLLVLAVPLADLVWVVVKRWRRGQPIYVGDTNHFSHELVRRGLSPERAVLLIWAAAAVIGGLGFILGA